MAHRLALHACCGPCSLEPVRLLREEGFEPTILWFNPNIQPQAEHDHRLRVLRDWAARAAVEVVEVPGYERGCEAWERACAPAGFDRPRRCRACYALRLEAACAAAESMGFSHVSTTLVVSPYQLFDECHEVLRALAPRHGLVPVWRDFRPWYPQATDEARSLGMYRQSYCGCRFSAAEAALGREVSRDQRKAEREAARRA